MGEPTRKEQVRQHGRTGQFKDEGGPLDYIKVDVPLWVHKAQGWCGGCHDDFYNGRMNCTGKPWCFSLKESYVKRKARPPCYH